jgi:hypothetical protein
MSSLVFIGKVKDSDGFVANLLENPDTGERHFAYSASRIPLRVFRRRSLS